MMIHKSFVQQLCQKSLLSNEYFWGINLFDEKELERQPTLKARWDYRKEWFYR
jgi:hypothetical protein